MGKLDDRVALVTGGSRGQGAAEGRLFAEEGAHVIIADVLDDEGARLGDELGESATYHHLDVRSEENWREVVSATVEVHGRIDILVNNAGILALAPMLDTSLDLYQSIIDVNQIGVFLGMKAVAPTMRNGGSIINISSVDGITGQAGLFAYCASKFAVNGMTRAAAHELVGQNIRVNSICPGVIETPMLTSEEFTGSGVMDVVVPKIPMNRPGTPKEIATAALFFASSESSFCTGSELVVDGGMISGIWMGA